jgi:hypothetical protein
LCSHYSTLFIDLPIPTDDLLELQRIQWLVRCYNNQERGPNKSIALPILVAQHEEMFKYSNSSIATLTYVTLRATLMTKLVMRRLASDLVQRRRVVQTRNTSILLAPELPAPAPKLRAEHQPFGYDNRQWEAAAKHTSYNALACCHVPTRCIEI